MCIRDSYEYGSVITGDLLKRFFKHPLLIGVYSTYYGYLGIPVDVCPFVCMALCYQRGQGTCYVKGGSAAISAAVTDEFIKHGGTVKLNTAVEKILVEDGAVKGVRCTNGEEYYADTVLTNCNKILTYIDMIDEQYVPEQVFDDLRVSVPSQSIFVVYLGLDLSLIHISSRCGTCHLSVQSSWGHLSPRHSEDAIVYRNNSNVLISYRSVNGFGNTYGICRTISQICKYSIILTHVLYTNCSCNRPAVCGHYRVILPVIESKIATSNINNSYCLFFYLQ